MSCGRSHVAIRANLAQGGWRTCGFKPAARQAVVQRIEVPFRIRLDRLHAVLQAAVGWSNSHVWEFPAGDVGWGVPGRQRGDGPQDASKATLRGAMEDTGVKRLSYLYDYGDGWEHTIRIEHIGEALPGELYPRLLDARDAVHPKTLVGLRVMPSSSRR